MITEGVVVEEEEVDSLSTAAADDDNDEKDKGKKESRKRKTSKVDKKHVVFRFEKNRIFIKRKLQLMF
jgi:hypothetical protein